jgi:hypothetical protein
MAQDPKDQLAALQRQVDANAPLSPEPTLTPALAEAAAQSRVAAAQVRDVVAEHADQVADFVRLKPVTSVLATFLAAYFLGRVGRYL